MQPTIKRLEANRCKMQITKQSAATVAGHLLNAKKTQDKLDCQKMTSINNGKK